MNFATSQNNCCRTVNGIAVTNANNEVVQAAYDSLNNIISLVDGLNHVTTWQYNEYGWLTNRLDGLGRNAFRYAYNPNGWVTNRWTPEKGNTAYAYDNVGNLTNIFYVGQASRLSLTYDLLNRLSSMQDAVGLTHFTYTPAGQLASESNAWTAVSYTYAQGLRTALALSQPTTNWSQNYGYDSLWRLTNVTSPAGAFNYAFDASRSTLLTKLSLPNGAYITNSYDALARLTQTALNNQWGHTLDGYTYSYDPLGLRTNITRNLGLTGSSVAVSYDSIGQITSWLAKEAGGTARQNEQLGFGYDTAHNLLWRANNSFVQNFLVDAANELTNVTRTGTFTESGATPAPATSVTVNNQMAQTYGDFTFARTNLALANGQNSFTNIAVNAYGVRVTNILTVNLTTNVTLAFDSNGNLTNDGVKTLMYDAENELTNITVLNRIRKDFLCDGLHRLRIKREYGWIGGTWVKTNETRFVWDGNNIVQLRDSNNVPTLTLTRGLDLSGSLQGAGGIGGLLAMTENSGASSYFHADAMGNVTALMDVYENIVGRREYDPWGRTINLTGSKTGLNHFWFSSQLHDEDTDIYSYLYRPYTPSIPGRFLTQDPLGEPGFELIRHRKANALAGGSNRYNFADNNPVNFIDPLGLFGADPYTLPPQNGSQINSVPAIRIDPNTGVVSNNDSPMEVALMAAAAAAADFALITYYAPELVGSSLLKALGWQKPDGWQKPVPCKDKKPPGWNPDWQWGPPTGDKDGDWRWFDPSGGEWHYHDVDPWHPDPHWDYNPWNQWNSEWQNIDQQGNEIPKKE